MALGVDGTILLFISLEAELTNGAAHFFELLLILEGATEKVCNFLTLVSENWVRKVPVTCHFTNKYAFGIF